MTPPRIIPPQEVVFVLLLCIGAAWLFVLIARNVARALRFGVETRSTDVAKRAREAGTIPPWPPAPKPNSSDLHDLLQKATDAANDPLNPQPKAIQPILFADGHLITQDDIHEAGLCVLINSEGRIDSVMQLNGLLPPKIWTVDEWCGASHGARIS